MSDDPDLAPLPASGRSPFPGARPVGPPDPGEVIRVSVWLRRGTDRARVRPARDRTGRLSRDEFTRRRAAAPNDRGVVTDFARGAGLRIVEDRPSRRTIGVEGPLEALERAFGVTTHLYEIGDRSFRGRTGPVRVPKALLPAVEGVFGLDDRPSGRPHFRRRGRAQPGDVSYSPLQVGAAYGFPPNTDGTGQSIGILEFGGGFRAADLQTYFQGLGVTPPAPVVVSVDGGRNSPTGDPGGPDAEVELDLEIVGALAPGAATVVYFAPNTEQGFLDALTTAVHDPQHDPGAISISWGGPEASWTAQARSAFSSACEDAASIGVTVLAASGDGGSADGGAAGTLAVDFPASSPFVLGCGGTRLTLASGAVRSEVVWDELPTSGGATGGGVSEVFPIPPYQAGIGVPPAPDGTRGRGVPDVAGDADPRSGYSVFVDGAADVIGGTSAVAPLWAALIVRLNQALGRRLGFVNPALYAAPTAFRDVTSGGNGGYSATVGWDACTGLGTPQGSTLLASLRAPPPDL